MIQIPTPPNQGATEAERQAFDDACRVADLALRAEALRQADEGKAHRDRMATATEANAAALRGVADKTETGPTIAEQKRAAVLEMLAHQARGTKTPAARVADARAHVDAVFAAMAGGAA